MADNSRIHPPDDVSPETRTHRLACCRATIDTSSVKDGRLPKPKVIGNLLRSELSEARAFTRPTTPAPISPSGTACSTTPIPISRHFKMARPRNGRLPLPPHVHGTEPRDRKYFSHHRFRSHKPHTQAQIPG